MCHATKEKVCRVCREPSGGGPYCSDICNETHQRLTEKNRQARSMRPAPQLFVEAPESPGLTADSFPEEPPESCSLYGLLTADDARELERRRAVWEANGRLCDTFAKFGGFVTG